MALRYDPPAPRWVVVDSPGGLAGTIHVEDDMHLGIGVAAFVSPWALMAYYGIQQLV